MSRSSGWPISDTRRIPVAPAYRAPRQKLPRVAWVLAVSAFLCGAMISAAVFAAGWKHEAQRGSSAQTALLAATARSHSLAAAAAAAQAKALSEKAAARRSRAAAATAYAGATALRRQADALATELSSTANGAGSVIGGASSLGDDLSKLTSELHALTTYLTTTPPSQIDGGYVATQTAYLTKAIARLDGDQASLASAAAAYASAAKAAAAHASSLAGR
ncbi:MAG TPA: hypothetical protein VMT74_01505 [Gaiellaceae bacterium]|nr:hypothetical protein [Gaiellaceae bacterium]